MKTKRKKIIYNILFFTFIIFLFTPLGLPVRAKLTQGVTFLKGQIIPPSLVENSGRKSLSTYNVKLHGINNASDVNLEKFKNKVIFINHWATWCPPCRAEMPSLNKLYKDYANKIAFVFITTDNKRQISKYYSKNSFNFPTYNLVSNIPSEINSNSIPATFIIDKNGKIALEEFGPANWNSDKVRKTLDNLLEE